MISVFYSYIVIRNRKIVWKNGPYFCLNLKYQGWPQREYIKTTKNGGFCEELLSANDFETLSAVVTVVPRLLEHFRISLQMTKIIANAPRLL